MTRHPPSSPPIQSLAGHPSPIRQFDITVDQVAGRLVSLSRDIVAIVWRQYGVRPLRRGKFPIISDLITAIDWVLADPRSAL
jgi:hypothetical protein